MEPEFLFPIGKGTSYVDLVPALIPLDDSGCSVTCGMSTIRLQFLTNFVLRLGVGAQHGTSPSHMRFGAFKWTVGFEERYVSIALFVYRHQGGRVRDGYVGDWQRKARWSKLSDRSIPAIGTVGNGCLVEAIPIWPALRRGNIERSGRLPHSKRLLTGRQILGSKVQVHHPRLLLGVSRG